MNPSLPFRLSDAIRTARPNGNDWATLDSFRGIPRVLIGTDGEEGTGKTEFMLSCPEEGQIICLDGMIDSCAKNPNPPSTRHTKFSIKVMQCPLDREFTDAKSYKAYWNPFFAAYMEAINNPNSRTVGVDGDGDSWDLQRCAEFGRLTQIMPLMNHGPKVDRRAYYLKALHSGKVCIYTNKLKPEWINNKPTGKLVRAGFPEQDYCVHIQLTHLFKPKHYNDKLKREIPPKYGIRINRCKANRCLEGSELWGSDCCFAGLVQFVYPEIPLERWGL